MYEMSTGDTPATDIASVSMIACPATDGALKPALSDPSLLMALPRMTAWIVSPSASASASRFSTTTPTPVPKSVPLAAMSNGRT